MSHFSVLVIGDDIERQLQPYHEFECTGIDDEFVQDVDVTAEVLAHISENGGSLADALSYHGLDGTIHETDSPDLGDAHKYGYAVLTKDGSLVKAINRTNPNEKWDGWVIGGRWSGFFKLKPGAIGQRGEPGVFGPRPGWDGSDRADQVRKSDIDFEAMRDIAEAEAADHYDAVHRVIAGRSWRHWDKVRDEDFPGDIEAARKAYNSQPVVVDAGKDETVRNIVGFRIELESFDVPRDEYLAAARRGAGMTFAVIRNGEWHERGRMGWWAVVHDKKDDDVWDREFAALIDDLPDDTLLTVVDCHI